MKFDTYSIQDVLTQKFDHEKAFNIIKDNNICEVECDPKLADICYHINKNTPYATIFSCEGHEGNSEGMVYAYILIGVPRRVEGTLIHKLKNIDLRVVNFKECQNIVLYHFSHMYKLENKEVAIEEFKQKVLEALNNEV